MKIGDKVRDTVTGLRGEITGEATYASGLHQFLVQPRLARDGEYQNSVWIDAHRLAVDPFPDAIEYFGDASRVPGRRD